MEKKSELSSTILNGLTSRRSNIFFERFIKIFFRRIDFDDESIFTLQEYADKGRTVFISFQSTNTSLLIFLNILKTRGFKIPAFAIDHTPYLFQKISSFFKRTVRMLNFFKRKKEYEKISERDYTKKLIKNGEQIIISLLSRKAFLKRYMEIRIDALQHIVEIQKETEEPIYLFPQILFWNRNPERTRTMYTSRATGDRGFITSVITLFKSATPAFIRISRPVNVKEEIEQSDSDDSRQIARKIRNRMLEIYNHEKRTILGPVIKSQQEMMEKVLYHKNVLDAINEVVAEEKRTQAHLRKKAYKYYKEIAADFSILYIRFFEKALEYIFNKIFDGIHYNTEDFIKIREASQKGPLILMPSHKSHMDYLILSFAFYKNKLTPPHIVAGSNLTFFPMGKIFRRSGAFFMRRTLKGQKLYAAVFKQYIKTLINEGYSIEFFIEGGRTRTGKLAFPKMGVLKYLIESIEEGYNTDMVFVPTSINYDRILEESSYQKELKGKEKTSESTSAFVQSRKFLKRKYGRVYLSFNEPVSYKEMKEKFGDQPIDSLTTSIGDHVVKQINEIIMVTPFSVTSSAILLSSIKGFSKKAIHSKIETILDYFDGQNIPVSESLSDRANLDEIVDYVLDSLKEDKIIKEINIDSPLDEGGSEPTDLFVINEDDRARINFYKNSVIHFTLPVALTASIINRYRDTGIEKEKLKEEIENLKDLFSDEFVYMDSLDDPEKVVSESLSFFDRKGIISTEDDKIFPTQSRKNDIIFFAKFIQDILESYFIVFSEVPEHTKTINKKDLMSDIRKKGIKMYHLGETNMSEGLSMPSYTNAVDLLQRKGIIEERSSDKRSPDLKLMKAEKVIQLREEVREYLIRTMTYL